MKLEYSTGTIIAEDIFKWLKWNENQTYRSYVKWKKRNEGIKHRNTVKSDKTWISSLFERSADLEQPFQCTGNVTWFWVACWWRAHCRLMCKNLMYNQSQLIIAEVIILMWNFNNWYDLLLVLHWKHRAIAWISYYNVNLEIS